MRFPGLELERTQGRREREKREAAMEEECTGGRRRTAMGKGPREHVPQRAAGVQLTPGGT